MKITISAVAFGILSGLTGLIGLLQGLGTSWHQLLGKAKTIAHVQVAPWPSSHQWWHSRPGCWPLLGVCQGADYASLIIWGCCAPGVAFPQLDWTFSSLVYPRRRGPLVKGDSNVVILETHFVYSYLLGHHGKSDEMHFNCFVQLDPDVSAHFTLWCCTMGAASVVHTAFASLLAQSGSLGQTTISCMKILGNNGKLFPWVFLVVGWWH